MSILKAAIICNYQDLCLLLEMSQPHFIFVASCLDRLRTMQCQSASFQVAIRLLDHSISRLPNFHNSLCYCRILCHKMRYVSSLEIIIEKYQVKS